MIRLVLALLLLATPAAAQAVGPVLVEDLTVATGYWQQRLDQTAGGLEMVVQAMVGTRTLGTGAPQAIASAAITINTVGPGPEFFVTGREVCYPAGRTQTGVVAFPLPSGAFTVDAKLLTRARLALDLECLQGLTTFTRRFRLDLTWTGSGAVWATRTPTPPSLRVYEERAATIAPAPLDVFAGTSFPAWLTHTATRLIATP